MMKLLRILLAATASFALTMPLSAGPVPPGSEGLHAPATVQAAAGGSFEYVAHFTAGSGGDPYDFIDQLDVSNTNICSVTDIQATEKYIARSADGSDTDRMTFILAK